MTIKNNLKKITPFLLGSAAMAGALIIFSAPSKAVDYYVNVQGLPDGVKAYVSIEKEGRGFTKEKKVTSRKKTDKFYSQENSKLLDGRMPIEYRIRLKYKTGEGTDNEVVNTVSQSMNNPLVCLYKAPEDEIPEHLRSVNLTIKAEQVPDLTPWGQKSIGFSCKVSGEYGLVVHNNSVTLESLLKDKSFQSNTLLVKLQKIQKAANLTPNKKIATKEELAKALKDAIEKINKSCKKAPSPTCNQEARTMEKAVKVVEAF